MYMKHKYILLFLSLFLLSCTETSEDLFETDEHVNVTIDIEDMIWDDLTRTSAEVTSSGIKFSWSDKDTIGIYPDKGSQVEFLAQASTGSVSTASFDGGAWGLKAGHTFTAFYPFKYNNRTCDNIQLLYTSQSQTGNNKLSGACAKDFIYAPSTTVENGKANFTFKHLGAFVYLLLSLPDAGSYKSVSILADKKVIPTKQTLNLSSGTPKITNVTKTNKFTLSLKSTELASADEVLAVAMFLPAVDLTGRTLTVQAVNTSGQIYESRQPLNLTNLDSGKAYRREVSMKRQGEEDPAVTSADVRFLTFGNSAALDAFAYVPAILQELMPDANINIGFGYKGGGSLAQNWDYIDSDQEKFTYYYYESANGPAWQSKAYDRSFSRCLEYMDWDYIAFHQTSEYAPVYSTYQPYLDNIVAKVKKDAPQSTPVWILTHSFADGYSADFPKSDVMYTSIASAAQSVANNAAVKSVIPSGTAIQNARNTTLNSLGEYVSTDGKAKGQLSFDGDHLQPGLPMLVASYTIAQYILNLYGVDRSIADSKFKVTFEGLSELNIPSRVNGKVQSVTDEDYALAKQCALNALKTPYAVTK